MGPGTGTISDPVSAALASLSVDGEFPGVDVGAELGTRSIILSRS
jgi:hypothetical protein